MTTKAVRDKLALNFDAAMQMAAEANRESADAKDAIIEFDAEFPEIMRKFHEEQGAAKVAALGTTGSVVEAEGHASLAAVEGEGG